MYTLVRILILLATLASSALAVLEDKHGQLVTAKEIEWNLRRVLPSNNINTKSFQLTFAYEEKGPLQTLTLLADKKTDIFYSITGKDNNCDAPTIANVGEVLDAEYKRLNDNIYIISTKKPLCPVNSNGLGFKQTCGGTSYTCNLYDNAGNGCALYCNGREPGSGMATGRRQYTPSLV